MDMNMETEAPSPERRDTHMYWPGIPKKVSFPLDKTH